VPTFDRRSSAALFADVAYQISRQHCDSNILHPPDEVKLQSVQDLRIDCRFCRLDKAGPTVKKNEVLVEEGNCSTWYKFIVYSLHSDDATGKAS
jgi:hypothetical protein